MTESVPASQVRVSDADRALVETRLRRAVEVGQLELREFDERAALTWAARTRADLEAVTADLGELPAPAPAVDGTAGRAGSTAVDRYFSDTDGGTAMKVLTIIWLCAMVASLATAVAIGIANPGEVPSWPAWLLPGGAVLGTLYLLGIGRPRSD